ncbi:AAA family ATPase [Desulfovibrio inopinatus]|uniref:AAA family ATPase n=1 Tax=Desulfovibrio inopinatus TaxID=102109 RepID=UPI0004072892|nr:AAA family ATPase [Desulfovibrio inopinatus]
MIRIHIFGASGSGTTTLGKALADVMRCPHYDTDEYFWMPTDPPFQTVRERTERKKLLRRDLEQSRAWILSGSLCGWGDFAIPMFDLVVFLWLPPALRMKRLMEREVERYGPNIESSDDPRYEQHKKFLQWAASYDTGGINMRSKERHEEWIRSLPCTIIKIEREQSVAEHLETIFQSKSFPNTLNAQATQ